MEGHPLRTSHDPGALKAGGRNSPQPNPIGPPGGADGNAPTKSTAKIGAGQNADHGCAVFVGRISYPALCSSAMMPRASASTPPRACFSIAATMIRAISTFSLDRRVHAQQVRRGQIIPKCSSIMATLRRFAFHTTSSKIPQQWHSAKRCLNAVMVN